MRRENLYRFCLLFPQNFILNALQKQNKQNCNRKCLLYPKTYSGFVLIALIWKRRKSQIKCLQRQFCGFLLSGKNELNLHFHCYIYLYAQLFSVVVTRYKEDFTKLLWKHFANREFTCNLISCCFSHIMKYGNLICSVFLCVCNRNIWNLCCNFISPIIKRFPSKISSISI